MKHTLPADPGTQFTPTAFDGQVGKTVPMNVHGHPVEGGCKIVGALVSEDRSSVELTLEVPDGTLPQNVLTPGSVSIAED
jgi:hypothetical protein